MWFLSARDVGVKIGKDFPEHSPRFERTAGVVSFSGPTVSRQQPGRGHMRTTRLKFENCHSRFGEIKIIVAAVEAAQNDVTDDGVTAVAILQLPNSGFRFGTKSGYLLRSLAARQQNCG